MTNELASKQEALLNELSIQARELVDEHKKELDAKDKRIAELEAQQQWQPIETAPKDGTPILVSGILLSACVARYVDDGFYRGRNDMVKPTHWTPLPQPPQAEGE